MPISRGKLYCPHCGETFELAQALAQEAIEASGQLVAEGNAEVQRKLKPLDKGMAQAQEAARQELAQARQAAQGRSSCSPENAVQQQQQIEQLQAQVIGKQRRGPTSGATTADRKCACRSARQWQEQNMLELQQRDNQIRQLTANLANLNAQAQQGHGQAAGEVGEVAVENILLQTLPQDEVQPVPAGYHGADLILVVRERGVEVGKIIIEVGSNNFLRDGIRNS